MSVLGSHTERVTWLWVSLAATWGGYVATNVLGGYTGRVMWLWVSLTVTRGGLSSYECPSRPHGEMSVLGDYTRRAVWICGSLAATQEEPCVLQGPWWLHGGWKLCVLELLCRLREEGVLTCVSSSNSGGGLCGTSMSLAVSRGGLNRHVSRWAVEYTKVCTLGVTSFSESIGISVPLPALSRWRIHLTICRHFPCSRWLHRIRPRWRLCPIRVWGP